MPGKIKLENIRSVSELDFAIPDRGVWLLTGGNGAGKSSLLACLRRIGYRLAFPIHFPGSQRSDKLDSFSGAKITYELNGDSVVYAYSGVRWVPTPKKGGEVLDNFGFKRVLYIAANADRITPRPEDFDVRRTARAKRYIVDNANTIFATDRFSDLRTVNVTRGAGNQAFVMGHEDSPKTYHSEKNFSMGELCILNLLKQLVDCPNNSLLLIDELELALHPRAQIELLRFLTAEASRKSLTVIFSTHSVSLLKAVQRSQIILLNNTGSGTVEVVNGCFPTFALGNIALDEERLPDSIVYVEDEMALNIVEPILKLCILQKYNGNDLAPTVRVLPIVAFHAVVKFLRMNLGNLPAHVSQMAALDEDVKSESLKNWTTQGDSARLAEFKKIKDRIHFLPWTPEVALSASMMSNKDYYRSKIRTEFMDSQFQLSLVEFEKMDGLAGKQLRDMAKRVLKELILELSKNFGCDQARIRKILCDAFAQDFVLQNKSTAMSSFGPFI